MEPQSEEFTEPCSRCRGRGVRFFGRNVPAVPCNTCKGEGRRSFKVSAEARAHTRDVAKARKARKLKEAIETFQAEHPKIWEWMSTADIEFATKMRDVLLKWGGLTEKQFAASQKLSGFRYTKRVLI